MNLSFFNKENQAIKIVDGIDGPLLDEKAFIYFTLHGKEDAFFIPKKQACYQ